MAMYDFAKKRESDMMCFKKSSKIAYLAIYTSLNLVQESQAVLDVLTKLEDWGIKRFCMSPLKKTSYRYRKWNEENKALLFPSILNHEIDFILLDDGGKTVVNNEIDNEIEASFGLSEIMRHPDNNPLNYIYIGIKDISRIGQLAELGSEIYSAVKAMYGFIILDSDKSATWFRIRGGGTNLLSAEENDESWSWSDNRTKTSSMVRDAFLVNYLNPEHIKRLGGIEKIRSLPFVKEAIEEKDHFRVSLDWTPQESPEKLNNVLESFRRFIEPISLRPLVTPKMAEYYTKKIDKYGNINGENQK